MVPNDLLCTGHDQRGNILAHAAWCSITSRLPERERERELLLARQSVVADERMAPVDFHGPVESMSSPHAVIGSSRRG
jgi:hypothetical protein